MTTTDARSARERELIDEIISMYHTTRLRDAPVADHVLSKPSVRKAFDALLALPPATPEHGGRDVEHIARRFHEAYERLAPQFGYETRPETRHFNPASANGQLMIAVCSEIAAPAQPDTTALREALKQAHLAISEYYRYWIGGETRGSYGGKPERAGLWRAMYDARQALALPSATPEHGGREHGVAWTDDRLGQAYQLIDEAYQQWPNESGPGEALRAAREAVEAADLEIPE